jgi:hypothetical protein
VGAVPFLNGVWTLGRIGDREIWIINVFAGGLTLLVSLRLALAPDADAASIRAAALNLLFSFTYLWVAMNRYNQADGRGLGWFSLFVSITAVPVAIDTLIKAHSLWEAWFGLCWVAWGVLWFLFFVLLALQKSIAPVTGWLAMLEGILTGWLPGYLLLSGILK